MNEPIQTTARPASTTSPGRRIAACVIVSAIAFLALWLVALSVVTALLISSGVGVVLVAASSVSDLIETVLDAIATVIFAIFAAIAAVIAAVLSLFGS
jgi:hypothetical protein